jgi:branched-chain amino acid transport system permease protein
MGEPDTDGALMKSADTATTTTTGRGRLSDLDKFGRRKLYWLGLTIVAIVFFATLPLYYDVANGELGILFFMVFIYGVVAQGWNLVAGYTGQISLGQNAFFGLGAFTTALLWFWNITHTGYWFDPVLMVLSLIVPAIVAILIGLPLLSRLRGDYFAFGTLGLGVIVKVLFLNGGNITGGSEGKLLIKVLPENVVFDLRTHYYVGLLVAIIATAVVYVMTSSRIGLALKAIREDEVSAASHGINVLRYKITAFAVAAALAGLAGSVYTYYLLHPMPMNVFDMGWLFIPIIMVVLGGTGTILGPWLGALIVYAITWYGGRFFPGWHPVILGVLMILVMLFLPSGLMGAGENINHLVFRRGSRAP